MLPCLSKYLEYTKYLSKFFTCIYLVSKTGLILNIAYYKIIKFSKNIPMILLSIKDRKERSPVSAYHFFRSGAFAPVGLFCLYLLQRGKDYSSALSKSYFFNASCKAPYPLFAFGYHFHDLIRHFILFNSYITHGFFIILHLI